MKYRGIMLIYWNVKRLVFAVSQVDKSGTSKYWPWFIRKESTRLLRHAFWFWLRVHLKRG